MGLTGARLKDFDAHALGLSTHMALAASLNDVYDALCFSPEPVELALKHYCSALGYQTSVLSLAALTMCFDQPTICSIQDCLANSNSTEAKAARQALSSASPRGLQETITLLKKGAGSTLKACLIREFEAAQRSIRHPDLAEGVRAILIDKDHTPIWPSAEPAAPAPSLRNTSVSLQSQAVI
jgi:enoyl-CoA hydratase